jgi:hypothetical protein
MKLRLLLMTDQIAAKAKLAYRVANMAGQYGWLRPPICTNKKVKT